MRLSATEFVRIAKVLADPQRCEILQRAAAAGELSCATMVGRFPICQATISHHLKELTNAGLLERRKEGQFAFYRFRSEMMTAYTRELARRMGVPFGEPKEDRDGDEDATSDESPRRSSRGR